jgi:putative membrane protein
VFEFAARVVINTIAVIAAIKLVPNVDFRGQWWELLILGAIIGLVNAYIRPIVKLLSLPLTLVTFGLIGLVINTAMVLLAAWLADLIGKTHFTLDGWPASGFTLGTFIAAFLTSIVISVVSALMALVRLAMPDRR